MVLLSLKIAEALARGATVLTGNQRAARTLRRAFDQQQRDRGVKSWDSPAIYAWDTWTASVWARLLLQGHATKLLLNRAQEHSVWRGIVAADSEASGLLTVDSLAEMAAEAWARLCAYRGEGRLRAAGVNVDTRAFQRWARAFEERCREEGYLPQAQVEGALTKAVTAGRVELAQGGYVLVGFDGLTPARDALAAAVGMEPFDGPGDGNVRLLAEAPEEREELAAAARWIRLRLDENAGARIALIVPGLEGRRAEIDRVLRRTLAPEVEDITEDITVDGAVPFEFSLGVPLGRTSLGAAALDLLRWTIEALPVERVSRLLLSAHLAGGAELQARAEFDAYELRRTKMLRPEITIEAMIRLVEEAKRGGRLGKLLGALKGLRRIEVLRDATLRPYADWAEAMRSALAAAGWGGAGASVEFQTQRKWEGLLDELATLDFTGVRVGVRDALLAVKRLARQTLFATESRGAPVQVMGPLESAGSEFDAVWFLGTGELEWPEGVRSSPLLSWHLQRELGMPGADSKADRAFARRVTERVASSGGTVIFSYAQESTKGRQKPSTVLEGLGLQAVAISEIVPQEQGKPPIELESIDDSASLPPLPNGVVRGGAKILQLQAACGFRAFAEQRLGARALEDAEAGMDARERGNAVHVALELFWKEVQSKAELKSMTTEERREVLAWAVETALGKTAAREMTDWDQAYIDVQRERLMDLLDAWLLGEMRRAVPFTVKLSETELKDVAIGPLRLNLRVDRVDETEFGDVIVDYKTGEVSAKDWLSERPDEPQLPLYAVLSGHEQLAGVAFGQVRAGKEMSLHGYATQEGVLLRSTKLKEAATLETQVEEWRRSLTALAEDFHRGDVRVRPKSYPATCKYCEQRLLCRLDIALLEANGSDEDTGDVEDDRG